MNVTVADDVDAVTTPEVTVHDGVCVVPVEMVQATVSPLPLAAVHPLIAKTGPPLPEGHETALDVEVPDAQPVYVMVTSAEAIPAYAMPAASATAPSHLPRFAMILSKIVCIPVPLDGTPSPH
ncbi:MAG: hypothetical protein JSR18_14300 [Proteobacteria bacterium]|nr:hypothetical protein [Pseudomonadota bacterium]